jgi:hypothetical protein
MSNSFGAAGFPIDAFQVIGQDYTGRAMSGGGSGHFERVALRLIRDRTD